MRDELSDPQASAPMHHSNPRESIPPPEEPKTPAWLTWVGLGLLLVALGWLAVRCGMESDRTQPDGAQPAPLALPRER